MTYEDAVRRWAPCDECGQPVPSLEMRQQVVEGGTGIARGHRACIEAQWGPPVIRVVLEVEEAEDGDRVHVIGVFGEGDPLPAQRYDHRNVVSTWMGTDHDVRAFFIETRERDEEDRPGTAEKVVHGLQAVWDDLKNCAHAWDPECARCRWLRPLADALQDYERGTVISAEEQREEQNDR